MWRNMVPLAKYGSLLYRLRVAQTNLMNVTRYFDILLYYYIYTQTKVKQQ